MIKFTDTSIVDHYSSDTVFAATKTHRAAQVTRVIVEVVPAEEDPESLFVSVRVMGYELTAKGTRDQRSGLTAIYGSRDEQERYELVREALLETVKRHDIDGSRIDDHFFTQTWDQYKAAERELILSRFHTR